MTKNWISGIPPNNIFFQTWWVWDGNDIFLAYWNGEIWELVEASSFDFKSENVTHYHVLTRPNRPHYLKKELTHA